MSPPRPVPLDDALHQAATAASIALPPVLSIPIPASDASACPEVRWHHQPARATTSRLRYGSILTPKLSVLVAPFESVVLHVTVVLPIGKMSPDTRLQVAGSTPSS